MKKISMNVNLFLWNVCFLLISNYLFVAHTENRLHQSIAEIKA
jgi:hypothetical protein